MVCPKLNIQNSKFNIHYCFFYGVSGASRRRTGLYVTSKIYFCIMNIQKSHCKRLRPEADFRAAQNERLYRHLHHCARNSPYYRRLFDQNHIYPEKISLENLSELPMTGKPELETMNDDFLAVEPDKVVDIVYSSGTTGQPTKIAYTENDLQRLAYNEHLSLSLTGITSTDTILLTCTMDRCFVAGLAYFLGSRDIGAAVIRNGHGTMNSHCRIIERAAPTTIIGVPSFLLKLGQHLQKENISPGKSSVKRLVCIGEPIRDRYLQPLPPAAKLTRLWNAEIYSTYASTETVTTFCECARGQGGHLHPELGILEIVAPNGKPLPSREVGEIVITPLGVEGMPFIRFRTGDLGFMIDTPCKCGRSTPRLGPIMGRRNQMLKLKGTTIYPPAIAQTLESIPTVLEHYVEVTNAPEAFDEVTVHLALNDDTWKVKDVEEKLQSALRVKPKVQIEPLEHVRKKVFNPEYRKPIRFFDQREK